MEIEKLRLLQYMLLAQGRRDLSDQKCTVHFNVAGVEGRILLLGHRASEMKAFLNQYLSPFPSRGLEPCFSIQYSAFEGELSEISHPYWNELESEFRTFPQIKDEFWVLHRDFLASVDSRCTHIKGFGPVWSEKSTDSIDNLLMFVFASHLPMNSAVALHAATVERNGHAYVFFGASGAGKSTLARHCFERDGLRVLSGDQIYLKIDEGRLYAFAAPTSIPEFPRGHHAWHPGPLPVASLIHLVQKNQDWHFRLLNDVEFLRLLLRETIFMPHLSSVMHAQLFEAALEVTRILKPQAAEMGYPKGVSFWSYLEENGIKTEAEHVKTQ